MHLPYSEFAGPLQSLAGDEAGRAIARQVFSPRGQSWRAADAAYTDLPNTFTVGPQTITADAGHVGLVVQGAASQDVADFKNSAGTVKAWVTSGGAVASSGSFTESATTAGAFIGITGGTPRIQMADGTNNVEVDNASGALRMIVNGNVRFILDPTGASNLCAFALNLSVGNDTTTAPPYSARAWIYNNVAAGTTQENPSFVIEQNTNGTPAAGFGGGVVLRGKSSTTSGRLMGEDAFVWVVATDAARTARRTFGVHDSATSQGSPREVLRLESSGSAGMFGAFGTAAVAQQSGDVLTALSNYGLVTSPTVAGRLIGRQVFTAGSFTYTPTSGTASVVWELQGGGAQGGGTAANPGAGAAAMGSGGSGGGYLKVRLTANFSGGALVVGAGGSTSAAGNNTGQAGGNTTFTDTSGAPTTYTATGGSGGGGQPAGILAPSYVAVTLGPASTNGDINMHGGPSTFGVALAAALAVGSKGGASFYDTGGGSVDLNAVNSSIDGNNAVDYGGGGGGAIGLGTAVARKGGTGGGGLAIAWEYS